MKVQFELTIGRNKFTLIEDVESHTDFFKKLSFYSALPQTGPNGELDLEIRHRVAQKQYDYYSIVCPSAKKEYKFGQPKESKGVLFPKGWEDLYVSNDNEDGGAQQVQAGIAAPQASTPAVMQGFAAPAAAFAPPAAAQPAPAPAAPAPQFQAPAAAAPVPQPQFQAPAAAAPAAPQTPPPAVQNQAAKVLSRFGI